MSKQPNYFRIGVFVIAALSLLASAIIILGASSLFRKKLAVETYVDESVQGLDIGSPVKMRGVKIGNISHIGFATEAYEEAKTQGVRYILIEFDVDSPIFAKYPQDSLAPELERETANGLRVIVAPQGITGTAYLEINYFDPERNRPLPISWTPENLYIPSAPSPIARLEETFDSVSKTLKRLEETNFDKAVHDLDDLINDLRAIVKDARVDALSKEAQALMAELRRTGKRIGDVVGEGQANATSGQPSLAKVMADISAASASLERLSSRVEMVLTGPAGSGGQDDPNSRGILDDLADTLRNVNNATRELPQTVQGMTSAVKALDRFTRRADDALLTRQDDLDNITRTLQQTLEHLNDASRDARRYPSYMLFGDAPKKQETGK